MKICARWFRAACLALVPAALAACALKTDPLIPPSPRPEPVKNIKAETRDAAAFLSWPIPEKNVEGVSLKPVDILLFRVYRAEFGRDRRKTRYKPYTEIRVASPAPAVIRNNVVFWTDHRVTYGYLYEYRIRAVSVRNGVSAWSDEVRVMPLLSPAVPAGVAAQGGDGYNLITWQTVTTWVDGSRYSGFVGYNVYRGTEQGWPDEMPLNKEPLTTTAYKDTAASNNRTYYYVVRSVNSPAPPWKESLDSTEVSAAPRDLTPPNKPTGLTVIPGVNRVFLTWNENKERDLAGYHVYRSIRHGKSYERLTDKLLARTTFSDETVRSGKTYYYVVTAVDQSGNESDYSLERKVFVEKLNAEKFTTEKPKSGQHGR